MKDRDCHNEVWIRAQVFGEDYEDYHKVSEGWYHDGASIGFSFSPGNRGVSADAVQGGTENKSFGTGESAKAYYYDYKKKTVDVWYSAGDA